MAETEHVKGRLVALHWSTSSAGQTMAVDTKQLQDATAEIEDPEGVTHRIEVLAGWDADYLIGKDVRTDTTDAGLVLTEVS